MEMVGGEHSVQKRVKCQKCGLTNDKSVKPLPEVIRRRVTILDGETSATFKTGRKPSE
jgi:hypothetical protein